MSECIRKREPTSLIHPVFLILCPIMVSSSLPRAGGLTDEKTQQENRAMSAGPTSGGNRSCPGSMTPNSVSLHGFLLLHALQFRGPPEVSKVTLMGVPHDSQRMDPCEYGVGAWGHPWDTGPLSQHRVAMTARSVLTCVSVPAGWGVGDFASLPPTREGGPRRAWPGLSSEVVCEALRRADEQ